MCESLSKQNTNTTMDGQSFESQIPMLKVQIMLVDDDATTLSIVSSMLKLSSRQETMLQLSVVTAQSPLEALSTLRVNQGLFDLVVSDLHMPEMNGFQLQKRVNEEFKLPVMIMSSDDKEQVMLECLQSGAVLYVVKPLNQDDLRNIWQYAVAAKKSQTVDIEEIQSINQLGESSPSSAVLRNLISNNGGGEINSATSMTEDGNDVANNNKDSNSKRMGRKRGRDDRGSDDEDDEHTPVATKKAKVVWTNSLHNRFLQAINHIGLEKAVPKKILEFMAVPGLTRENVASHLQKYRLFLKRVAEKGTYSMRSFSERSLRSNFPTSPAFDFQDFQSDYLQFTPPQEPFHPGIEGNVNANSNHALSRFPHREPLKTNFVPPQYPYGQSRFPGILLGFQQPSFDNSNPTSYQANRPRFQPNIPGTNPFPQGNMPYGLMNGTNIGMMNSVTNNNMVNNATNSGMMNNARLMHGHQQQGQVRPLISRFGLIGIGSNGTSYASGFGNMGAINNTSNITLNADNGHAGTQTASNGPLVRMEQEQFNGNQRPNGFNNVNNASGYGFMNGKFNNNISGAFGNYSAPKGSASAGFGNGNQMLQTSDGLNQGNASIFSSQKQQQQFGHRNRPIQNCNNNYTSNPISNQNQQQIGGVSESLFNSNNILQQGVASSIPNVNFCNSEVNPSMGQPVNTSIPGSYNYNVQLNNPIQLQGKEQAVKTGFIGNGGSQNDYHPIFEQQRIEGLLDFELADIFPVDNGPLGENWRDDFMDTLFDHEYPI